MLWSPLPPARKPPPETARAYVPTPGLVSRGSVGPEPAFPKVPPQCRERGSPRVPEAKLPPPSLAASEASWAAVPSQCPAGKPQERD